MTRSWHRRGRRGGNKSKSANSDSSKGHPEDQPTSSGRSSSAALKEVTTRQVKRHSSQWTVFSVHDSTRNSTEARMYECALSKYSAEPGRRVDRREACDTSANSANEGKQTESNVPSDVTTMTRTGPREIYMDTSPYDDDGKKIISILTQSTWEDIPIERHTCEDDPKMVMYSILSILGKQYDPEYIDKPKGIYIKGENEGDNVLEESRAGCDIRVSTDENGEIQGVMAYTLPHTLYPDDRSRNGYESKTRESLSSERSEWRKAKEDPAWDALMRHLRFQPDHKNSICLNYLHVDPSHRNEKHGSRLLGTLLSDSEKTGQPIWLVAHNDGAEKFYKRHVFKQGHVETVQLDDGKSTDLTAFTYIPKSHSSKDKE